MFPYLRSFFGIALILLFSWKLFGNPILDDDSTLKNALAVQQAMEKARHYLLQPDAKKAVEVLEDQLPRINGNANFLRLLREAYRAYINDLWLANKGQLAEKYLERLCIIDPSATQDPILCGKNKDNPEKKPASPALTAVPPPQKLLPASQPTVRAKNEDPFDLKNQRLPDLDGGKQLARQLTNQGEAEFARRRYTDARNFYERAYQADPRATEPCRDRWAYCMLNQVVEQLNQPSLDSHVLSDLQKQVQKAIVLAPSLGETGKWLLREIDNRTRLQLAAMGPDHRPEPILQVKHLGRNPQGWQVTETAHYRIFHNQPTEFAEKVAQVTENTRQEMYRKWFGHDGVVWQPKCDIFLHANAGDYSRITGVPSTSPGHARIETDPSGQRVVSRRLEMHADQPAMLETVLPHETTHVVLAGMFGHFNVPRWADEGMAVLTEPSTKIEEHRRNLNKSRKDGQLFSLRELLQMPDYPHPRRIGAFYAQSVFVVEFLAAQKGPVVFTEFVRDGLREGYELALRRHYGWSFSDLESRWAQYAFAEGSPLAQGK